MVGERHYTPSVWPLTPQHVALPPSLPPSLRSTLEFCAGEYGHCLNMTVQLCDPAGNCAMHGCFAATDVHSLRAFGYPAKADVPELGMVRSGVTMTPPPQVELLDYYGQVVRGDGRVVTARLEVVGFQGVQVFQSLVGTDR